MWIILPGAGDQANGGVAQMVERSLSMREVQGSIPCISIFYYPVARSNCFQFQLGGVTVAKEDTCGQFLFSGSSSHFQINPL